LIDVCIWVRGKGLPIGNEKRAETEHRVLAKIEGSHSQLKPGQLTTMTTIRKLVNTSPGASIFAQLDIEEYFGILSWQGCWMLDVTGQKHRHLAIAIKWQQ